jgi:hypothetical protein
VSVDLKRVFHSQFRLRCKVKLLHIKILPTRKPHFMHLQVPQFMLCNRANIKRPMVHDLIIPLLIQMDVAVGATDGIDRMAREDLRFVRAHWEVLSADGFYKTAVFLNWHVRLFDYIQSISCEPGDISTPLITIHHHRPHKTDIRWPVIIDHLEHLAPVPALIMNILKNSKLVEFR